MYERRTGELLGRVSTEGKVLTGSIPKKALSMLKALGKIGGIAIAIFLELADPAEAIATQEEEMRLLRLKRDAGRPQSSTDDPCITP